MAGMTLGRIAATVSVLLLLSMSSFLLATQYTESRAIRGRKSRAVTLIERQLSSIEGQEREQEFVLHISAGHLEKDQGHYGAAVEHYNAARTLAAALPGSERLVTSLQSLGQVELLQGRLALAQQHLERARTLALPTSAQSHDVLRALANVRRARGHSAAALELFEQARELGVSLGSAVADTLPLLDVDAADALARSGELEAASKRLQGALDAQEALESRLRGAGAATEGLEAARTRSVLGSVVQWQGDVERALGLYRKAMATQLRKLRADHPDLVRTRLSYARALRDRGDLDGALEEVQELEEAVRAGANEGLELSSTLMLEGDFLREAHRYSEAERALGEAAALQSAAFDVDVPEMAIVLNLRGSLQHDRRDFRAALEQYGAALEMNERTVGSMHPEQAAVFNNLGTLYMDLEELTTAEFHFKKCLEIQLASMPQGNSDHAVSYNNLATVLFRQNRLAEAKAMLQQAVAAMDAAHVPAGNPERALYAEHLQQVALMMETPPQAPVPTEKVEEALSTSFAEV